MSSADITKAAQDGGVRVFCLLGTEELLAERAEDTIRKTVLPAGTEVFNLAVFRGDDERVDAT